MVPDGRAGCDTAFSVSIDHVGSGSGIGAADRAHTIKKIVDPSSRPSDFIQPGHVFPLRAKPGGVLERRGHTEAAVDLCQLAGLAPAAVICEVLHDDGSPARLPFLELFAQEHRVAIISVEQIAEHRSSLGETSGEAGVSARSSPISRSAAAIAARMRRAVAGARCATTPRATCPCSSSVTLTRGYPSSEASGSSFSPTIHDTAGNSSSAGWSSSESSMDRRIPRA
jgi:hypothetical protein